MTSETAIAPAAEDRDHKRSLALLKAVGLDRVAPEQRELAVAIAKRYDLDLLLKHLVIVDGKPYVTRDALLHIAHRSGQFDGITVSKPVIEDKHWYAEATVWRKDMSHPFVYGGRYPVTGKNQAFAPEMAVKVAESMALRRAFNISAPSSDERWDVEVPSAEPTPVPSLADRAAERRAALDAPPPIKEGSDAGGVPVEAEAALVAADVEAGSEVLAPGATPDVVEGEVVEQCVSRSPFGDDEQCRKAAGHEGLHRTADASWPEKA